MQDTTAIPQADGAAEALATDEALSGLITRRAQLLHDLGALTWDIEDFQKRLVQVRADISGLNTQIMSMQARKADK